MYLYPEPLENWNLDSAKAPAVRSIAKRSVLMQYGPLCDRRTPGLWRSRNSNLLTARGIIIPKMIEKNFWFIWLKNINIGARLYPERLYPERLANWNLD